MGSLGRKVSTQTLLIHDPSEGLQICFMGSKV